MGLRGWSPLVKEILWAGWRGGGDLPQGGVVEEVLHLELPHDAAGEVPVALRDRVVGPQAPAVAGRGRRRDGAVRLCPVSAKISLPAPSLRCVGSAWRLEGHGT